MVPDICGAVVLLPIGALMFDLAMWLLILVKSNDDSVDAWAQSR